MADKLSKSKERRIIERFPRIFEDLRSGMAIKDICSKYEVSNPTLCLYWKKYHNTTPKKHQQMLLGLEQDAVDFTPHLDTIVKEYRSGKIPRVVARQAEDWQAWTKEMIEACSNGYFRGYAQGPLGYVFENLFVAEFKRYGFDQDRVRGFFKRLRGKRALTSEDMKLGIKVQQYFQKLGGIYPQGTGPYEFGELVYVSESRINHEDQAGKWARPSTSRKNLEPKSATLQRKSGAKAMY